MIGSNDGANTCVGSEALAETIRAAPPGKHWKVWRPLGSDPGSEVSVAVIRGAVPGPLVWLEAAMHGDEFDAALVAQRVAQTVDPEEITGTLVVLPLVHAHSFAAQQRFNPADPKDINRCFPGDAKGTATEQLAAALWEVIASCADYLLDLHSSTTTYLGIAHAIYFDDGSDIAVASRQIAERSLLPVIWESTGTWLSNALYVGAARAGIPSALLDVGDLGDTDDLTSTVDGVLNVLRHLKLLTGETSRENQLRVRDPAWRTASEAGIRVYTAQPGVILRKGDALFRISHNDRNEAETTITDDGDYLVVTVRRDRAALDGLDVVSVGPLASGDPPTSNRKATNA